ncbi:uncharacterized protein MONBRDRAFT_10268 [Monosiga brevicollis MX1]|uniref:Uncharacterized protein n=1 Tax=Monosiga brevicollis TaxID=81824 RepID=A9V5Q4_MONBE|nr:uncharacterized protein MONBRDRAFT_10268 [Monosiga brevicollis MX1]EDQ87157.1 predicted protein [Monosiga brevicollis MX1]|eukprot:XP_001748100.1 hypothetical protein [Monosiga brevicollis MX1]
MTPAEDADRLVASVAASKASGQQVVQLLQEISQHGASKARRPNVCHAGLFLTPQHVLHVSPHLVEGTVRSLDGYNDLLHTLEALSPLQEDMERNRQAVQAKSRADTSERAYRDTALNLAQARTALMDAMNRVAAVRVNPNLSHVYCNVITVEEGLQMNKRHMSASVLAALQGLSQQEETTSEAANHDDVRQPRLSHNAILEDTQQGPRFVIRERRPSQLRMANISDPFALSNTAISEQRAQANTSPAALPDDNHSRPQSGLQYRSTSSAQSAVFSPLSPLSATAESRSGSRSAPLPEEAFATPSSDCDAASVAGTNLTSRANASSAPPLPRSATGVAPLEKQSSFEWLHKFSTNLLDSLSPLALWGTQRETQPDQTVADASNVVTQSELHQATTALPRTGMPDPPEEHMAEQVYTAPAPKQGLRQVLTLETQQEVALETRQEVTQAPEPQWQQKPAKEATHASEMESQFSTDRDPDFEVTGAQDSNHAPSADQQAMPVTDPFLPVATLKPSARCAPLTASTLTSQHVPTISPGSNKSAVRTSSNSSSESSFKQPTTRLVPHHSTTPTHTYTRNLSNTSATNPSSSSAPGFETMATAEPFARPNARILTQPMPLAGGEALRRGSDWDMKSQTEANHAEPRPRRASHIVPLWHTERSASHNSDLGGYLDLPGTATAADRGDQALVACRLRIEDHISARFTGTRLSHATSDHRMVVSLPAAHEWQQVLERCHPQEEVVLLIRCPTVTRSLGLRFVAYLLFSILM